MKKFKSSGIIYATARYLILSLLCPVALCCMKQELPETETGESGGNAEVRIRVCAADAPWQGCETKSSFDFAEDHVGNIVIGAYMDGYLARQACLADNEDCTLVLPVGKRARIYALANLPAGMEPLLLPIEEEKLKDLRLDGYSLREYSGFPMAGVTETDISINKDITVALERLVAKIDFAIDRSAFETMKITGVKFCNAPADIAPFGTESKAASAETGDYAVDIDLQSLNEGGTASFYMFENCQGRLLPDNTEQKGKVPANITDAGGNPDLCTYIEVTCESRDFGIASRMTYRMYLGEDTVSDFTIRRNTWHKVTLVSSYEGLGELTWRITPVVNRPAEIGCPSPQDIAAKVNASHSNDLQDIYVGERFIYSFSINSKLAQLLEIGFRGQVLYMKLRYYENGVPADNVMNFAPLEPVTEAVAGVLNPESYKSGISTKSFSIPEGGEIWLCRSNGDKVIKVSGMTVKKPVIRLFDEAVRQNTSYINGSKEISYRFYDDRGNIISPGPNFNSAMFSLAAQFGNSLLNTVYNSELAFHKKGLQTYEIPMLTFDYSLKEAGKQYAPDSPESNAIIAFHYNDHELDRMVRIYDKKGNFNSIMAYMKKIQIRESGAESSYYDGKETISINCAMTSQRKFLDFDSTNPAKSILPDIGLQYSANIVYRYFSEDLASDYSSDFKYYNSSRMVSVFQPAGNGYEFISKRNLMLKLPGSVNRTYVLMEVRVGDFIIPADYYRFSGRRSPEGLGNSYMVIIFEGRYCKIDQNYTPLVYSNYPDITYGIYPCDVYDPNLSNVFCDTALGDQDGSKEALHIKNEAINGGTANPVTITGTATGTAACWTTPKGTINAPEYNSTPLTYSMPSKQTSTYITGVTIIPDMLKQIYNITWYDSKNWIGSANNFQHRSFCASMSVKINIGSMESFILTPYNRSVYQKYRHEYDGDGTPNKKCQQYYTFPLTATISGTVPQVRILL